MLLYKTADGAYYTESDMTTAFHICTGTSCAEHYGQYHSWVNRLTWGGILNPVDSNNLSVAEIAEKNRVLAMRIYRERTDCTLRQAMDYVNSLTEGRRS